jgi:hydrogenase maturation protein HypF
MCPACRREYQDPLDRRFHAQPTACPACGPQLALRDAAGRAVAEKDEALARAVAALRDGRIVAIKGLGGYHLACEARRAAAVAELRRRKHRDEKPLAIMVRDLGAAAGPCAVDESERALLTGRARPIVLLRRRQGCDIAEGVAPGNPFLGLMLPYTPLHHLLLHDLGRGAALVMTSGNRSDEPIAYEDDDALARLAGIADLFLTHDRPIHVRCDDSVTRVLAGAESPVRRSRGYAPQPLRLPVSCAEPILAVGGQLKATFALGEDRRVVISHHMGDLDEYEAYRAFERDVGLYQDLFRVRPARIAYDAHPDYASTRYAQRRAAEEAGISLIAVQHHHAHLASCMAENGLVERVIGVTFDGTGYGTDGRVWGGEFLVGDYCGFRRAAHLRYVGMPGGERAIREPWRMALAHLLDGGCGPELLDGRIDRTSLRTAQRMLERGFNSPLTSSAGRLFDAVASLAGVRDAASYEGQAAMELEWLAARAARAGREARGEGYPFEFEELDVDGEHILVIDPRPLVRAAERDVARGTSAAVVARRFHDAMVDLIAATCRRIRRNTGLDAVVLSGGVFMNALLTTEVIERLAGAGFRVFRHRLVPPNDGGLSLGQLAVAAARGRAGAGWTDGADAAGGSV